MEIAPRILVLVFFSSWFALTIANQFGYKWAQRIKELDLFHLLPRWTFFAPNPGTTDFHFVYRSMDLESNVTLFQEIPLNGNRSIVSACWNSEKRIKKALSDLVIDVNRLCVSPKINESNIKLTFSYIALLNFLTNIPKPPNTRSVQFAILRSNGFLDTNDPQLIICSDFHDV